MFTIRPYQPADASHIAALIDDVHGAGRYARAAERLREHNQKIDDFCFCAEDEKQIIGQIIGSISYWRIKAGGADALLLGPLVVKQDWQGQGVGQKLMAESLAKIDQHAPQPVVLVGDLPYYQKAGFLPAEGKIWMPQPVDPQRLLVRGGNETLQGVLVAHP